jgi:hypothetical protein
VPLLGYDFSDTSVTATLPSVPSGHYLMNVTTQGLTSSWIISVHNTAPPDTSLDSYSPSTQLTNDTTASFSFSSGDVDLASFECSLDGATFTPCSNPQPYDNLGNGPHTFEVRAIDTAGNLDPTPTTYSWEVDATPPPPPDIQEPLQNQHFFTSRPVFSGAAEAYSFVRVVLDGVPLDEVIQADGDGHWELHSPKLTWGNHHVTVRATDRAENTSELSLGVAFTTAQRSHYGCATAPSTVSPWFWALGALELLRRRRSHGRQGSGR